MSSPACFPDQHRGLAKGVRPTGQVSEVSLIAAETAAIAGIVAVGVPV